ncbi:MAG: GNAT family N-acetyltransferase [Bdellovibrionota bacterium]
MIRLEPMTEPEYQKYVDHSCRTFAIGSPRFRGVPLEVALVNVREEFLTKIMPQGFQTPGHLLWNIWSEETRVGYLHLGEPSKPVAKELFAWDLEIFEPFRRRGLARQTMIEAGKKLKELGYTRVGLNVFGDNKAAIALYESMGFQVTQVQMSKEI